MLSSLSLASSGKYCCPHLWHSLLNAAHKLLDVELPLLDLLYYSMPVIVVVALKKFLKPSIG